MLDQFLVTRILLNVGSIVYFILLYRNIRFHGVLFLAVQVAINLILRLLSITNIMCVNDLLYDIILFSSNLIGFIAAKYLYESNKKFSEGDAK